MKCKYCDWTPPLYVGFDSNQRVTGADDVLAIYTTHLLEHVISELRDVDAGVERLNDVTKAYGAA